MNSINDITIEHWSWEIFWFKDS